MWTTEKVRFRLQECEDGNTKQKLKQLKPLDVKEVHIKFAFPNSVSCLSK